MRGVVGRLVRACGGPAGMTDDGLVAAYLADPGGPAFTELVARHGPVVFGVCRRVLRHTQDAEDAFQATFLVLARRAGDVWPRAAVGAWLYGVAYRVAMKARAARDRRRDRERPLDAEPPVMAVEPDGELAEAVARVVARLPEVYRAAVVACELQGLSRKDAAARLGWPEGTLSGRLARARKLLADRVRRAGLTLPAGGAAAVFGPAAGVEARLIEAAVKLATVSAAGVPAAVAVLSDGVVGAMVMAKVKAVTAAVMVAGVIGAGVIGAGAWVTAGAGDGPGGTAAQPGRATSAAGGRADQPPAPAKLHQDLARMQGRWRVITMQSGRSNATIPIPTGGDPASYIVEVRGDRIRWQLPGPDRRPEPAEYRLDFPNPGLVEQTSPGGPVLLVPPHRSREVTAKPVDLVSGGDRRPGQYGFHPRDPLGNSVEFRLAFAHGGTRPFGFGTEREDVTELGLIRMPGEGEESAFAAEGVGSARAELQQLARDVDALRGQKATDPAAVERLRARVAAARALLGDPADGPKPPLAEPHEVTLEPTGAAEHRLAEAERRAKAAARRLELAHADLGKAEAEVLEATKDYQRESDAAAEARKAVEARKPPAGAKPADPALTVYVRLPDAPEKAIPLPATGNDTVLDAITAAGDAVPLVRGPDALSVWVARGKTILSVDLDGIINRGDSTTNYQLQAGDKLFFQVKLPGPGPSGKK